MNHFNFKSLVFYGVAIASVLLLFNTVTSYGETKIKAPVSIDGSYRLAFAESPSCLKSNVVILSINQSGIYLNGFLLPTNTNTQQVRSSEKNPLLTGFLSKQQLSLTGKVPDSTFCNSSDRVVLNTVEIQGQVEGENLAGKMTLANISETIKFTARKEAAVTTPESSTSH